jgi:hypothetical protein
MSYTAFRAKQRAEARRKAEQALRKRPVPVPGLPLRKSP